MLFRSGLEEADRELTKIPVALAISPKDDDIRGVMRVIYDGNHYKLKINKLR